MNSDFAIIFAGATERQNINWWPSYHASTPGINFDLIYVHRDFNQAVRSLSTEHINNIYFENKVFRHSDKIYKKRNTLSGAVLDHFNKNELPNKAFGAYAHYFEKYKKKYKYFAFISDDVYLRRNDWLKEVRDLFEKFPKLGFVSPMLHNNPRHIRAPIWFGRTECLEKISFDFKTDHDGEMEIADRCTEAGYFGIQIGHKCDFAYDPEWFFRDESPRLCGTPMPIKFFEDYHFGPRHYDQVCTKEDIQSLDIYEEKLFSGDFSKELTDSSLAVNEVYQRWNIVLELQPFHGLIYNPSLAIVKAEGYDIKIFDGPIPAGPLDIDNGVYFGKNHRRYHCLGVNADNPIAILAI